ncbi:MAG: YdcH family protein [Gammaproteobacteria bacterium]
MSYDEAKTAVTEDRPMTNPLEPEKHRALRRRLELLTAEHRTLDEQIRALSAVPNPDQIGLQRLKKNKLELREEIERIKSDLIPDLNA